jgi:predicted O-methyltransferase YrrM
MPRIIEKKIEEYVNSLVPKSDAVLAEMERHAEKRDIPILGPACGRLLMLLTQISGAKRIFEMGSAIGYSTIWFARAAGADAEVFYTDGDPENARRAAKNFDRAGVADRVRLLTGDAVELIDTVPGEFDLILIDVDKHQYPATLKKAVPRLRSGGLLVTDNVLWHGRVTSPPKDDDTRGVLKYNQAVYASKELFTVILPLRDGIAVSRKQ